MIGRKTFLVFVSRVIGRLFEGIIYLLAVNFFLPINFGFQRIALSILSFFTFFSTLGLNTSHLKIIGELEDKEENEAFTTFLIIKLGLIIISTLIIFSMFFLQVRSGLISNNNELKWIFVFLYVQNLLISINSVFEWSFRAKMMVAKIETSWLLGIFFYVVNSILSIVIFKNFLFFIFGSIIAEITKFILFLFLKDTFRITHFNYSFFKKYFKLNIAFLVSVVFNTLILNLGPLFFLKYYDEEFLGIYSVLLMIFLLIGSLEEAFRSILIPNFITLLKKNDLNTIKNSIDLFEKYMTIINGLIILIGFVFGEFFITKFLGEIYFIKGKYYFYGSLLVLLRFSLYGPYSPLVIAAGKFRFYNIIIIMMFAFSYLSWIIFIPIFDILGIELGFWISQIPAIILIRIYCQKHFNVGKMENKQILHLIFLSILITCCYYLACLNLSFSLAGILLVLILCAYIILLYTTKIIRKADFLFFWDMINPRKMLDYVKSETTEKLKFD